MAEDDQRVAVEMLRRREVTAVIGNYLTLVRFAREQGLPELVARPVRTFSYHLATRRGRGAEFAWTFNAMARAESDGLRDGLVEKHLSLPLAPWSFRNMLPVAGGLLGVVAAGGMLVYLWNRTLRREVAARTEELGSSLLEKEALARYLHLTNATLQAFIQSSPLAIISLDPDGNVRNWNVAGRAALRLVRRRGGGPSRCPTVRNGVGRRWRSLMKRALSGESLQGVEILRHRKDGTPVHAAIWAAPLFNEAGETAEIVAFVADTTLEKRLAEQLQQAQKMEAVGRLAGGIAHDFNNVLTAITGYCELALRKIRPDEPVRRHLEGIRAAADKATAFTRQVLSFSRKQKSSPRLLDLDDVAASVVSMLHPIIGEDIRVVHARSSALWPVMADPGQLQQVLLNLAVNARDAMPEGGELRIETANVELPDAFSVRGAGPPRDGGRPRHRGGDGRRRALAPLRALLHHQGPRTRHGPRPRHRPRHREPERRPPGGGERGRAGEHLPRLPAPDGGPEAAAGGATGGGRAPAAARPSSWWRTTTPCASSTSRCCARRATPPWRRATRARPWSSPSAIPAPSTCSSPTW